jgi:hypothetical protein
MDNLATDVLRELKRKELKNRIILILISGLLLFVTNFLWFIQWNSPPKDDTEIILITEDDENDNPQSENEKSE